MCKRATKGRWDFIWNFLSVWSRLLSISIVSISMVHSLSNETKRGVRNSTTKCHYLFINRYKHHAYDQCYGGSRNYMLGDLTPSKLASTILSALKCRCDILWLLLKEHSCYQSEVSSKSFCLKGLAEPLPPTEREVHEGFNIKIFDCQIDCRGESIDKCRYLLITPVSQVISRIILSICNTNWFAYYTQIN